MSEDNTVQDTDEQIVSNETIAYTDTTVDNGDIQLDTTVDLETSPITSVNDKLPEDADFNADFLSLLNIDLAELDELSSNYPTLDGSSDAQGRLWLSSFLTGVEHLLKGNGLSKSVERGHSTWKQRIEIDGEKLGPAKPRFGTTEGGVISGEKAILKVTASLGLGANVQIPLWHTGIWVSMKAPSESSLLELERRIANEKVLLGRSTSGMIFSNVSVYSIHYVVNFILNHVYDASVKNISPEALKKLIKVTDIPTLLWGMQCAINPNGYNYARPCTTDPTACQEIVTGKINLSKLFWTDNDSLTDFQRRMMSKRSEKFNEEELKKYESEHIRGGVTTVTIKEGLRVKLRVPSIAEYEQSGFTWVDGIVKMLEGALGVSLMGKERDQYIMDQGRITGLRQFSHWVTGIEVDDGDGFDTISDRETLDNLLGSLTSNEEITLKLYEEVGKFIDDSTISLIAIPKYTCPKCGGEQKGDIHTNKHPHLLPIDVLKVFFTLLDHRVYKALTTRQL